MRKKAGKSSGLINENESIRSLAHRMFSTKIKQKSVYAPAKSGNEVLVNPFVRLCY